MFTWPAGPCFAGQQNSLLWGGKQEVAEEIRIDPIGVGPKVNGTLPGADSLSVLDNCYISSSFFGLLDLLAILPFYLGVGVDLRAVRTFRLLRLIRILKLARYSAAVRRLHRAAIIVREELVLFLTSP